MFYLFARVRAFFLFIYLLKVKKGLTPSQDDSMARGGRTGPMSKREGRGARPYGSPELDLRLAIFDSIREPGREYSQAEIAAAVGCSRSLIGLIERGAMMKLRAAALARREVREVGR